MKNVLFKTVSIVLMLATVLSMLSACSSTETAPAATAVADAVAPHTSILFEADGKKITVEEADSKSMQSLLKKAHITLNDGDVLSVSVDSIVDGSITIQVLRKCTVTITVPGEESDLQYTAVLVGGTVADALSAVGVVLAEDQIANYEMDKALEDGMEIIISIVEVTEETTEPETTEPETTTEEYWEDDSWEDDYWEDDYWEDDDWEDDYYIPTPTAPPATQAPATQPPATQPPATEPPATEPPATQPPATEPPAPPATERYVVSVEVYEDCDGSGHGVKVITYSDGTQEEVYF